MGVVFRLIVPKIKFFMKVMLEKNKGRCLKKYLYDFRVYCESKNIEYVQVNRSNGLNHHTIYFM